MPPVQVRLIIDVVRDSDSITSVSDEPMWKLLILNELACESGAERAAMPSDKRSPGTVMDRVFKRGHAHSE